MRYLLTCSCHKQDVKAAEAFKLLFPGEDVPEVIKGRDRIYKLAISLDNPHIKAISRLGGKYAYFVEVDDQKQITKEYNLITGERVR